MSKSLFCALSHYQATESRNPKENFTTEALTYLLQFSLASGTPFFGIVMALFGLPVTPTDYDGYAVASQQPYMTSDGILALPDISITNHGHLVALLEVKVESGLNYYEINNRDIIDQLTQYGRIASQDKPRIWLLTKYLCHPDNPQLTCARRWSDISQTLSCYTTQNQTEILLLGDFNLSLKENGMSLPKVGYELSNGMDALNNLFSQIELILEGRDFRKSFGYEYLGYYIQHPKVDNKTIWFGTYWDGRQLTLEANNQEIAERIKTKYSGQFSSPDNTEESVMAHFVFDEQCYFCLPPEKQILALKTWFDEKISLIFDCII